MGIGVAGGWVVSRAEGAWLGQVGLGWPGMERKWREELDGVCIGALGRCELGREWGEEQGGVCGRANRAELSWVDWGRLGSWLRRVSLRSTISETKLKLKTINIHLGCRNIHDVQLPREICNSTFGVLICAGPVHLHAAIMYTPRNLLHRFFFFLPSQPMEAYNLM